MFNTIDKFSVFLVVLLIILIMLVSKLDANININYDKYIGESVVWVVLQKDEAVGKLYLVDEFGELVFETDISSGAKGFRTPTGSYKIYYKKRFHMSTKYPEDSGINNMDFSLFFLEGFALHEGNPRQSSHGCIHVEPGTAEDLFFMTKHGTRVIVSRFDFRARLKKEEPKLEPKPERQSQFAKDLNRMLYKLGGR